MKTLFFIGAIVLASVSAQAETPPLRLGILADSTSDFWTGLRDAAQAEAATLGITLDFRMPDPATVEQQQALAGQMLEDGVKVLAICPKKPAAQQEFLRELAGKTVLVTLFNDVPDSGRRVFLGRDEHDVGLRLGALVKATVPEGLKVMAFSGDPKEANTQARLAGLRESLGEDFYLEGPKVDQGDRMLAAANAGDIVRKRPEIACLIGLQAYHARAMVRAVTEARRARMVRIVAFNATEQLRPQIKEGVVHGLVIDDAKGAAPVVMKTLKALGSGDASFSLPEDGRISTPVTTLKTESALSAQEMIDALNVQVPGISESAPEHP